jgi:putative FmdB family regulatory protein
MPEYTLRCRKCELEFEQFAWAKEDLDAKKRTCPRCGSGDAAIRWEIALSFENLANFGCA